MGIGDSAGRIHDFAGPCNAAAQKNKPELLRAATAPNGGVRVPARIDCINVDDFMVGCVWRYAFVSPPAEAAEWDAAIDKADAVYSDRVHDICCDNCHHHTALALKASGRPQWGCAGLISPWLYCCLHGRCTWCHSVT